MLKLSINRGKQKSYVNCDDCFCVFDTGQTPLSKQGSHDSGSDVPIPRQVNIEEELNKGLTEEFSKKLAEWEKLKKSGYGATSPKTEPKQKRVSKDKKETAKVSKDKDKQKNKDSPLLGRRSKSPEGKVSQEHCGDRRCRWTVEVGGCL